jgi:hypothetical protein
MKKLLITSILLTLFSIQALAQIEGASFPTEAVSIYSRENGQECNVAIKLMSQPLSFQQLSVETIKTQYGGTQKLINNVPHSWLEDDKTQWRSGCRPSRNETEFPEFINFLTNNYKLLNAARRADRLKYSIESETANLASIERNTEKLIESSERFELAKKKFQECDAYQDNIDLRLYNNDNRNYSFLAGLCTKYKKFNISKAFFSDTLTITFYKLSMNGERPITFELSKNEQDVWEADSYENYYHGDQYSIAKVWQKARNEVHLAGMRSQPRADLPYIQTNPNFLEENNVKIENLKEKIKASKDELEELSKKYS